MTMLSNDRHRRTPEGQPRSGGRTAGGDLAASRARGRIGAPKPSRASRGDVDAAAGGSRYQEALEHLTVGAVALAPQASPDPREDDREGLESRDHLGAQGRRGVGERADSDHLLRVAPPAPVRAPRTPFIMLVLVVVIAGFVGILLLNTKINENVFRLHELQQNQETLDERQQQLEADLAREAAPGTVAGKAKKLGMRQPTDPPAFLILPDGRRLDVPQPAVGR